MAFSRVGFGKEKDPLFHKTDLRIRIPIKMKRIQNTGGNLYLFLVRGRSVPGGRGPRQPTEGRQHHHRKQVPDTLLGASYDNR